MASIARPWRARSPVAKRRAFSGLRLHTRTRRSGRTALIAARWVIASTPEPRMARSPASSRASARVATPLTAAVRMAVMLLASINAIRLPLRVSNSITAPWCESSSVPWLPGKTLTTLSPRLAGVPR